MIHESAKIHPSAVIEDGVIIGANVTVGHLPILQQGLRLVKALR